MPLIRRTTAGAGRPLLPRWGRSSRAWIDRSHGDERVELLRKAAANGDWPGVRAVLDAALDGVDLTWLVEAVMTVGGVETWIPAVVEAEPDAALPLLVSGARHIEWAWEARTRKMAKYVSKEQFEVFHTRLRVAEGQLYAVAERAPEWVAPWYLLQISGRGLQVGQAVAQRRFEAAVRRSPGHLAAHRQHLQQVCRKWSGSHARMHAFAREAMLGDVPGGPLGELVAIAHLEQWLDEDGDVDAPAGSGYMGRSAVVLELYEAAERSVHHPDHVRHRDWTRGFNTFALAFALAGERDAAADLFRVLDGSVTEFPWMYLDGQDPTVPFRTWRSRAGA
ncbi:hypothetical protein [Actinacidiphila acidipaludis]|uniref:DUF4034 domain-containing protein n=1 Tax=Actinacidiphila acidipaludis TaxID=2873382 RepID=A0ABS7Q4M3_9ACTN|nr:hypothetical protein [Streptomyces acidipaludis]MBY8877908.1 hypothetical protein [Streptomyces acidipaludis]